MYKIVANIFEENSISARQSLAKDFVIPKLSDILALGIDGLHKVVLKMIDNHDDDNMMVIMTFVIMTIYGNANYDDHQTLSP